MTTAIETTADQWISRLRPFGWGLALVLFVLPFVAMQFTSEVNWTTSDFVFWGVLLAATGVALELIVRVRANILVRGVLILAVLTAALLVWADGAVGIF